QYADLMVILYDTSVAGHALRYKIGWNIGDDPKTQRWDNDFIEVKGMGDFSRGGHAKLLNIDDDPRPDLLVASVDPATGGFTYAIGWNLGMDGRAERWEKKGALLPGIGANGRLAGLGVTNLNADPRPDLLVMAYDAAPAAKAFKYAIVP